MKVSKDKIGKDCVFFIVSNEPWGKQWFLKHHYANELARLGFEVYFCNPVGSWSPRNLFGGVPLVSEVNDKLSIVDYGNRLPLRLAPKTFSAINDRMSARMLQTLVKGRTVILWQFDAFRFSFNHFENSRKIYHVADHYRDLPLDSLNAENADLIVCTSETFLSYYRSFGKPVLYIPHAVSAEESDVAEFEVDRLISKFGRFVLHAGSLNDRVDLEIFGAVCDRFPDINLVLVGPDRLGKVENQRTLAGLRKRTNFFFEGVVDAEKVKNYARASEACLVAYDFEEKQTLGPITSSLKVLNYLAQSKPVVSSSRIEYEDLLGNAIYYCSNPAEYLETLDKVLKKQLVPDRVAVREFLDRHTYVKFIGDILNKLAF